MVYVLTLVAALVVASGEVVQQRMAAQAPPQDNLSPKLLLWLVRQPRWLAGVGCSLVGNMAFAAALNRGSVVLVEAVFVTRLVFGLTISALWGWQRVPARDFLGGAAIAAGLIAFLMAAQPRAGQEQVGNLAWAVGTGIPVVTAALLGVLGSRLAGSRRALVLGLGAGLLFAVQAALIRSSVQLMSKDGLVVLLRSWHGYAVVVVALCGMLLVQSAFESSVLSDSYPGVVTAQLLGAIGIGVLVLQGQLVITPLSVLVSIAALATMITGMIMLTRSPLVTGQSHASNASAAPSGRLRPPSNQEQEQR